MFNMPIGGGENKFRYLCVRNITDAKNLENHVFIIHITIKSKR